MAKKLNGSIPFALMFKPTGGQPLDDRVVVAKIADLHDKDTFGDTSYLGMMVVVEEDNQITIDFHVIIAYGVSIATVSDNLIETVKYKVESFTGMKINKINIYVEGVRVID